MDLNDSQNSEALFDDSIISCGSPLTHDTLTYKSCVNNVKEAFNFGARKEIQKPTFSKYFTNLLQDCSACINQSLELILGILSEEDKISTVSEYLNNAVCILQQMSDFIKLVIESVTMSCCTVKIFPTTTAAIIESVFRHCKDSESLYGNNLKTVEKQLKDLFRSCHELQLTYLLILEKHFIFDLTEMEEKEILIEALNINLRIGEIVQSLDVKTMAEQWKAYTVICEKYTPFIKDTNIFQNTSQVLCLLAKNNIDSAVENNKNEKLTIRSLKVASFTIKILVKICCVLKQSINREYKDILDLVFYVYLTILSHIKTTHKSNQLPQLMHVNVTLPTQILLKELLTDQKFVHNLYENLKQSKNTETLAVPVIIITSIIKCILQANGNEFKAINKTQLVDFVYNLLDDKHFWITHQEKIKTEPSQSAHTLFDHLVIHITALAVTMSNEEINVMEKCMIENILGTDCLRAQFSCKLWMLLARHSTPQLLFNQLIWLCTMFKKLTTHKMFSISPQKIHLSSTIGSLFQALENEEKIKICKQFRIHDDDNLSLWVALKVKSLPTELKNGATEAVIEKLKNYFRDFVCDNSVDVDVLINLFKLAEACTFSNIRSVENLVTNAWLKACPKQDLVIKDFDSGTIWYYNYVEALASLSEALLFKFQEKNSLVKILHIISSLIQTGNTDLRLLLINILCQISTIEIENKAQIDSYLIESFKSLLQDRETGIKLINKLRIIKENKNLERLSCNEDLQDAWYEIKNGTNVPLKAEMDISYIHKCYNSRCIEIADTEIKISKTNSSNFDFAEIETLFEYNESVEPLSKKVKLNSNEAHIIISRLETDSTLLGKVKENVFTCEQKVRIKNICDMLNNIVR